MNFRIYVLPKVTSRADSHQGTLFSWANQYFSNNKKFHIEEMEYSSLNEALTNFTNKHCNAAKFVEHLTIDKDESEDYFHWKGIKYFLARYEEELQKNNKASWDIEKILIARSKSQSGDYISLEHIWAQKNRNKDFPSDYIEKRRLGNFVIMPLRTNIQLKAKDIPKKIDYLFVKNETKHMQVVNLKECLELKKDMKLKNKGSGYFAELSTRINDKRETELIKFALETWKIDQDKRIKIEVNSLDSVGKRKKEDKFYTIKDVENKL